MMPPTDNISMLSEMLGRRATEQPVDELVSAPTDLRKFLQTAQGREAVRAVMETMITEAELGTQHQDASKDLISRIQKSMRGQL